MTDTASVVPDALESTFRLVASVGKKYRYSKAEIELAKDLATFLPEGALPTHKDVIGLFNRSSEWLRHQQKPAEKLLKGAGRSLGVCPIPVKGEPGVKFTDAHIQRALTIAFYSNSPPKNEGEAEMLLTIAAAGVPAYLSQVAYKLGLPLSVQQAVVRRYNSIPKDKVDAIPAGSTLQWLREEMEFQRDPFSYAYVQTGADIEYLSTTDAGGRTGVDLRRLQSVSIAMREFSLRGDAGMPAELLPLSRLEQARALYSNPIYSHLLKAVPALPRMVVLEPDTDAMGPQSQGGRAAQTAPLGPGDTGAHAIPLGKGRKKAGPETPEAPAEDAGGELDIDVDVETPQAAQAAQRPAPETARPSPPLRPRLSAEPAPETGVPPKAAETPEFLHAKKLINQAANQYRKARETSIKNKDVENILLLYPHLPALLQEALTAAKSEDVPRENVLALIAEGPKSNGGTGQLTGRKGLVETLEAYQSNAVQSIGLLEIAVAKQKKRADAGETNMYAAKKAELDKWQATQSAIAQALPVMAEVLSKFGSTHPDLVETRSAIAQEAAISHVRTTGMVIDAPEKAMELFIFIYWKSRVEAQLDGRVRGRLLTQEDADEIKDLLLQDEQLRRQGGFANIYGEIFFYENFFREEAKPYPAKLVAYILFSHEVISEKVYLDTVQRLDAEKPEISNADALDQFIKKSWKVWAVERASFLTSNGLISFSAGERALKAMFADKELANKGCFSSPHEELLKYVEACQYLKEPYPAKLALHLLQEGGRITQIVHGAALRKIIQEKRAFKDGNEFGVFLNLVGNENSPTMLHPVVSDKDLHAKNVPAPPKMFGGGSSSSPAGVGLLAIPMGKGLHPHPAPNPAPISIPPVIPTAIGTPVMPGAAGSTGQHPAADADDGGKTTTMAAASVPGGAAAKPETVHPEAAPEAAPPAREGPTPFAFKLPPLPSAAPGTQQPAPMPASEASEPVAPGGVLLPSQPPAIPPREDWMTTAMRAPKLGASAHVPQPVAPEAAPAASSVPILPAAPSALQPMEAVNATAAAAASVPEAAALTAPSKRSTDLTPIPAEIIAASASAAPTPSEALPPSFVRDLSGSAGAAEPEMPAHPQGEEAAPAAPGPEAPATPAEPVAGDGIPAESSATICAPPSEELVAQAADSTGERPTIFSEPPQELLDAAAKPEPALDGYAAGLAATLLSGKPFGKRVAAAELLVEGDPSAYVPVLLTAYRQHDDIQPIVMSLLAGKGADEVLPHAFAHRDSIGKDGILDVPLHELAGHYRDSALPAMFAYFGGHRDEGTLGATDVALALEMAQAGGISDARLLPALFRVPVLLDTHCGHPDMQTRVMALLWEKAADEVLPHAFAHRDALAKDGVLDAPLHELAEHYEGSALPAMLAYVTTHRGAGTLEDGDAALVLDMAGAAGIMGPALLSALLPAISSLGEERREGVLNFARKARGDALNPILAQMDADPAMEPDIALSLAKAARDAAGNDAAPVLGRLLPRMGEMDQDRKTLVGVLVSKFGEPAIHHVLSYAASGAMGMESAAVLSRGIEDAASNGQAREFLGHVLPMLESMDESQMIRVEDLAAKHDCSGTILEYAGTRDGLTVEQALAIARLLTDISIVRKLNKQEGAYDGAAFLPRLLHFADGMDEQQKEYAREYAAHFGEGPSGKDSAAAIRSFMAARGGEISAKEAALAATSLVRTNTEESFAALRELFEEKNLPPMLEIQRAVHHAVKDALASEYARTDAAGYVAKVAMLRAALYEKGELAHIDSLAFEAIRENENPASPSPVVIQYCIDQHLTPEVDVGDNLGRVAESRDILVKFGDHAIGPLWSIALSPDFSIYPEGHRTNVLRTIAHIAEKSTSETTKHKARECIMEAVKNPDLSPDVVGSAIKVMETNVIAALRGLIYDIQSKGQDHEVSARFEKRVCGILASMGEAGQRQILEALNSRDPEERLAGATIQGFMLMHSPGLAASLASDRKKPEGERKLSILDTAVRTLVHMLRDRQPPSEKDSVAVMAHGALLFAGPMVPAGDLLDVATARDSGNVLSPEQGLWSRAVATELLARAEGGEAALLRLLMDPSLAPDVRLHAMEVAAASFGTSLLPEIVGYARGDGMGEKYAALGAACGSKSPLASLLDSIAIGVEDWAKELPAAGIEPGKPPEQWQQDLFRWAVVRGLVQRSESVAMGSAESAYKLVSSGLVSMREFGKDLKDALDENARGMGKLHPDAEERLMTRLELLADKGFDRKELGKAVIGGPPTPFSSQKYREFIAKAARKRPTPQPPADAARADGSGAGKLPK